MASGPDDAAVRRLVDLFIEGWNAKDGAACARPFAVDADFVNILGLRARGRDLIARGHHEILTTIYRETQISGSVQSIRFVRPDVAVVDVDFTIQGPENGPFRLLKSTAGIVAAREDGGWAIVAFRNMVPFERPAAGPLERSLTGSTANAR